MLRPFANALERRPRLVLIHSPGTGHQTGDGLTVPGNDDLFATLDQV